MSSLTKMTIIVCLSCLLAQPSEQGIAAEGTWDSQNPASWYRDSYASVNNYLVDKVDSSAPMSANIDALVERLKSDEMDDERKVRIIMRKLIGLKDLASNCDSISYEALRDHDEGTSSKARDVTSRKAAPRRIDKLVNYYAKQHAITCQKKTESLFKPMLKLVDKAKLNRMALWLDPTIERLLVNFQPTGSQVGDDISSRIFNGIIKTENFHKVIIDVEPAYNAIKADLKNNPEQEKYLHYFPDERNGRRTFNPHNMLRGYIGDPCSAYIDQISELFERAQLDANFHHAVNPDEPLFYRGWAYYKICFNTLYRTSPFYNDLRDHIKNIATEEEKDENQ